MLSIISFSKFFLLVSSSTTTVSYCLCDKEMEIELLDSSVGRVLVRVNKNEMLYGISIERKNIPKGAYKNKGKHTTTLWLKSS